MEGNSGTARLACGLRLLRAHLPLFGVETSWWPRGQRKPPSKSPVRVEVPFAQTGGGPGC